MRNRWRPAYLLLLALVVPAGFVSDGIAGDGVRSAPPPAVVVAPVVKQTVPAAAAAPHGLPVIDYWTSPRGFPADPTPASTADLTVGLRAKTRLVLYDSPGGRPRAFLPSSISGVPVVVPVVARRTGWVAVLLPSVNRRVGWLPATGWAPRRLRDQLVLRRRTHELTWLRNGHRQGNWTVAVGTAATPTPLGRTFVLGRTTPRGRVYAGLDALALGSIPDDRRAVPAGLRGAHTGIHGWYRAGAFGRDSSNGCIRVPGTGQRTLLTNIAPGTSLIVLD